MLCATAQAAVVAVVKVATRAATARGVLAAVLVRVSSAIFALPMFRPQ